jgi:hypothetical protein
MYKGITLSGVKCPFCGNEDIVLAMGGTNLRPTEWEKENIKYICTNSDCLLEFGDNNITELDNPNNAEFKKGMIKK